MKTFGAAFVAMLGLAMMGFAAYLGVVGAEPALPAGEAAVEGVLEPGSMTPSPVGEPFLYGEVRIQDADNAATNLGSVHWRGTFGHPDVVVRTSAGPVSVRLPELSRFRAESSRNEQREVQSLEGLPIVSDVRVGERLSPPFRLSLLAVRPGDAVVIAMENGRATRVYLGERATLEREHRQRESRRGPIVGLFALMGATSLFFAYRITRLSSEA